MKLRVHHITWNIASTYPKDDYYRKLFSIDEKLNYQFGDYPDFYVISLQEQSIGLLSLIENQWESKFKSFFKILRSFKHINYIKLKTNSIFYLYQYVFVKAEHLLSIKNIQTLIFSEYAGINGKGTIAYKFKIDNESFIFLTSHLHAHDYGNNDRIQHYKRVMKDDTFYDYSRILNSSFAFFIGDLNFRLTNLDKIELINDLNEKGKNEKFLEHLLNYDQLIIAQRNKEAFAEFEEGKIKFKPTFKFQLDSNEYNPKRTPSYCDRILYRHKKGKNLKLIYYNSIDDYTQSDHRPVIGVFDLEARLSTGKHVSLVRLISTDKTELDSKLDVWLNKKPDTYNLNLLATSNFDFSDSVNKQLSDKDFKAEYSLVNKMIEDEEKDDKTKLEETKKGNWDWIGLYKEDFDDLEDYLAYLYVENVPCNVGPPDEILAKLCNIEKCEEAFELEKGKEIKEGEQLNDNLIESIDNEQFIEKLNLDDNLLESKPSTSKDGKLLKNLEWTKIEFSEQTFTQPGKYILIYFNGDGSVECFSEPFEVIAN